jgi:cytochrome c oxidase subunit 2
LKLEADEPGTYRGQCAEYCGLSHADMRLRVIAQTPADYQKWMNDQLTAKAADVYKNGVQNAKWGCTSCHSFDPKVPGVVAPNLTHVGDRIGFAGDKYEMTFDNLWRWVYDAPGRKPMGKLTQRMPSFRDAGMNVDEAKAIAKFLLCDTPTTTPSAPECK